MNQWIIRQDQITIPINQALGIPQGIARRFQDFHVVPDRDQPAIKHPVSRARQRHPVLHGVGAAIFNRLDMRCRSPNSRIFLKYVS